MQIGRKKPLVADQVLEIDEYGHLQATILNVLFGWQHYLSEIK